MTASTRDRGRPQREASPFTAAERLNLVVVAAMIVGLVATAPRVPGAIVLITLFAVLWGVTAMLPRAAARTPLAAGARWCVPGVVLLSVYESLGRIIAAVGTPARDPWILALERQITRGRLPPLRAMSLPPVVSDMLSIAYLAYFIVPVALVWMLIRQRRARDADRAMFALLVAFYLHYVIYLAVPVVGPLRTTALPVNDRSALAAGGPITDGTRRLIGALEGTPQDAFPSAHTSVTLVAAAFARHHRLRGRVWFYGATVSIVMSAVLLGYHYVVDVLAALPIAVFAWYAGQRLAHQTGARIPALAPAASLSASTGRAIPRRSER